MAPIARTSLGVNPRHPETPLTRHTNLYVEPREVTALGPAEVQAPPRHRSMRRRTPWLRLGRRFARATRVATPSPLRRLEAPLASLGELKRSAYSRRGERGEAGSRRASGLGGRAGGLERDRRRGTSAVHTRGSGLLGAGSCGAGGAGGRRTWHVNLRHLAAPATV